MGMLTNKLLPDMDSSMAFIFRLSSSANRWTECRWNWCRVSGLGGPEWWWLIAILVGAEAGNSIRGNDAACSVFFRVGVCTGVCTSVMISGGGPMLISRPRTVDATGNVESLISSSQENSKMFLMPFGMGTPVFLHRISILEILASSLGAMAVYSWYSSRLLFIPVMLLAHVYC